MNRESRNATLTRRSFLKALGLSATALPFYRMLENHVVLAQTGQLPLKFLGLGFFHGTAGQYWSRRDGETNTDFSLTYDHSPFKPFDDPETYGTSFKDRVIIFEGFDFGVGEFGPKGEEMHVPMHGAMSLLLTGSCHGPNATLQNESIDQYLAAKYGGSTRFRSLQIRGYDQFGFALESGWLMSYGSGGAALSPLHDPLEIWDKFFASAVVGEDPEAQAAAARKRAIGASVLDFVVKDLNRMNARLAGPEREKLDQHLTVVRGLEARLGEFEASAQCSPPPRRNPRQNNYALDKFSPGNVRKICEFNMELLGEIIVCDLTRFATFLMPNDFGPSALGVTAKMPYDGTTVEVEDGSENSEVPIYYNSHDNGAHRLVDGNGANAVHSQQVVAAINRHYFSYVAKLMQRFDQAGILDSTVMLVGSDGGDGAAHSTRQVPILLCGGANGKVKVGKRVVAPTRKARAGYWCQGDALTSHNPILVAVANMFGEELTSYGTCGRSEYTQGVSSLLG